MTRIFEATSSERELRPTQLEVDLAVLRANYRSIVHAVDGAKVMPILKANAYGHGLISVGKMLEGEGVPYLGVAYLEEGLRLREEGVCCPVLVLGGIVGAQIPRFIAQDLTLTASSIDKLTAIEECAASLGKRARVHLKIDTGMERIGVHWARAERLLEHAARAKHVDIEGIFTHFAGADEPDLTGARRQLARFEEVLSFYPRHSLPMPLRHAANSGAILRMPESHLDMVRPGILFYGASPDVDLPLTIPVQQALRWVTRVVYFKVVEPGRAVSYGGTWSPSAPTRLITLPVGYGDGYARAMSGKAEVLVHGVRRPVVGRICMDQIMVDIGWSSAFNGDEVVLLGRSGVEQIRIEELARWAGTIPHDVLTGINTRVPRVAHDHDQRQSGPPGPA